MHRLPYIDCRAVSQAVYTSSVTMMLIYFLIGTLGYYYKGANAPSPITSELTGDSGTAVNAMVFVHVIVAYVIEANVLCHAIFDGCFRHWVPESLSQCWWFIITIVVCCCAFMVANMVPDLNLLVSFKFLQIRTP